MRTKTMRWMGWAVAGVLLVALIAVTIGRPGAAGAGGEAAAAGAEGHGSGRSAAAPVIHSHDYVPTQGQGGQLLPYRLEDGVKVFELAARQVEWEFTPGKLVTAWGWNGTVPGPEIRVIEGDRVRIIVTNESLPEPTTLHLHGLKVPNAMDGVPGVTQDPIAPGGQFTYEFVAGPAGTHWYHSHFNSVEQVGKGLYGAITIDRLDEAAVYGEFDRDYTLVLADHGLGLAINGKGFPATERLTARLGERVRLRLINSGDMVHPIHLHGLTMEVIAKDGYALAQPQVMDTVTVAPGETYDVAVLADNPGDWLIHCHVLSHAENRQGMFGMATVLEIAP